MIRSRSKKRKEHLGLVWSPVAKQFIQPAAEEPAVNTSIYHAQAELSLGKEINGLPGLMDLADVQEADSSLESPSRWKESLKKLSKPKSAFRQGIGVLENLQERRQGAAPPEADGFGSKMPNRQKRGVKLDLPAWTKSSKKRKQLRYAPSRWVGQGEMGGKFKRLRQTDWSLVKGIHWPAVAWGWVVALAITVAVLGAAALYVAMTPGSVFYLSTYLMLNKVASPFFGSMVAGWKAKRKGWQCGLWVGLGYGLAIMVFRLYGGLLSALWVEALTGLAVSILAGMIGGAIGRALAPEERRLARAA